MTFRELSNAMIKNKQTLEDISSIFSAELGIITPDNYIPEDVYVFTKDFTYIVAQYDGSCWFAAVPTSIKSVYNMSGYGDYGG